MTVEGLRPGASYRYTVDQDGARFAARFDTAPTTEKWKDVRIIAFADTETEPRGRIEHREWELNPFSGYAA
ncbi:MAG: phosphoesterase, partial [Actinomycetota bacterium]|nr:phosphoesterase [Actinomycetota bacterium]